jgi:ABC-type sugar transport system ATPase subunit
MSADPSGSDRLVLQVEGLSKAFGGVQALRDVDFDVRPNEIHALVGVNGSGKSTLIKVLSGYHHADAGIARLNGEPFDLTKVAGDRHKRMRFVHQDLGLIPELGVMDNLGILQGYDRGRAGRIRWRDQARTTQEWLDRFELDLDLRRPLSEAAPVDRVLVAVIAAIQDWVGERGVLVLDEPTAVLPPTEVKRVFQSVARLREDGASVVYVSHRLDEIFEIADRVTVLRGGTVIATKDVSELTVRGLGSLMVGEDVDPEYRASVGAPRPDVAIEAKDVRGRHLRGFDFTLRRGEILGLAGLPGSGREELPYAITGALGRNVGGRIRLSGDSGKWTELSSSGWLGIPIVPADREAESVIDDFSVGENLTLSILRRLQTGWALASGKERNAVGRWVEALSIKTAGERTPITTLSGGNQQKVVMARCLAQDSEVLVLCEPTAGVDIGTRISIYDLVAQQAKSGLAVLVSSSDIGDLLAMCTRVIVMVDGKANSELSNEQLSETALLYAIEGA